MGGQKEILQVAVEFPYFLFCQRLEEHNFIKNVGIIYATQAMIHDLRLLTRIFMTLRAS